MITDTTTNTFLNTVDRLTKLKCWKIIPILRRIINNSLPFAFVIDLPSIVISPEVISCRRLTDRNNVDFPAPDKPTITAKSPFSMFKLISFNPHDH